MTREPRSGAGLPARLVAITATVVVLALGVVASVGRVTIREPLGERRVSEAPRLPVVPIAAEAGVFVGQPSAAAAPPWVARRTTAHPRTLSTARGLRAYPGAPPRIPHGLTRDEFRDARCLTCHEHGGFSQRFGAYAPMTPHPEFEACLQCHATNDALLGIRLPDGSPDAVCRQCHAPGAGSAALPTSDWHSAPWPTIRSASTSPPTIPHDLHLRGNCVACHMGPAAIAEIRTSHPERANCRQCHVATDATATREWSRPVSPRPQDPGGAS